MSAPPSGAPCGDCGWPTAPDDGDWEYYMVAKDVWEKAGAPDGFLCVGCLELRLGRELVPADFPAAIPLNERGWWDSPRLAARKGHI